jgi:hypothetical protein
MSAISDFSMSCLLVASLGDFFFCCLRITKTAMSANIASNKNCHIILRINIFLVEIFGMTCHTGIK